MNDSNGQPIANGASNNVNMDPNSLDPNWDSFVEGFLTSAAEPTNPSTATQLFSQSQATLNPAQDGNFAHNNYQQYNGYQQQQHPANQFNKQPGIPQFNNPTASLSQISKDHGTEPAPYHFNADTSADDILNSILSENDLTLAHSGFNDASFIKQEGQPFGDSSFRGSINNLNPEIIHNRSRSGSNASAYMSNNADLPIPGQYRLPTPNSNGASQPASHRNSFVLTNNGQALRSSSPHPGSESGSFYINTETVLPHSPYDSSAIAEEEYISNDGQFLMPTAHNPRHVRSASVNSVHSDASAASGLHSPAFRASSPLLPITRSPYLAPEEGSSLGNDFSIDGPLQSDPFTRPTQSLFPQSNGQRSRSSSVNSQNGRPNFQSLLPQSRLSSASAFSEDMALPGQSNALTLQQAQVFSQSPYSSQSNLQYFAGSQYSQVQPQQQIQTSNSESVVTTPEITIDVVQDTSPYAGSPVYHSSSPRVHSPSPRMHSPVHSAHSLYSDVESFPALETPMLQPPSPHEGRRRSHSESSLNQAQNLLPGDGLLGSSPGFNGFYANNQHGSNVSLASVASGLSVASGASGYSNFSDTGDFLSPEAAGDNVGQRRRRLTVDGSDASPVRDSLSPGDAPRRRPGRPPGSGRSPNRASKGDQADSQGRSRSRSRSSTNEHFLEMANPSSTNRKTRVHPPQHKCPKCEKTFTRAYNLQSHLRTHTNERPYKCRVCRKAFARQHDRKRHEDLHTGEKKYECSGVLSDGVTRWGCGHKFARADALGRHFRTEVGRQCIRPLQEEAEHERQQMLLQQQGQSSQQGASLSIYDGNSGAPALMVSPPPSQNANVSGGGDIGMSMQPFDGDVFPQALLRVYPMLANLKLDLPLSNSHGGLSDNE